ncbi:unnamed protein product, partial [Amoebophrya sp. A25]
QSNGGKTRLRGRGVGGPHESSEPLALCISCQQNAECFAQAVELAERELTKVHADYRAFCIEKGVAVPDGLGNPRAVADHAHTVAARWKHQQRLLHLGAAILGDVLAGCRSALAEKVEPPQLEDRDRIMLHPLVTDEKAEVCGRRVRRRTRRFKRI